MRTAALGRPFCFVPARGLLPGRHQHAVDDVGHAVGRDDVDLLHDGVIRVDETAGAGPALRSYTTRPDCAARRLKVLSCGSRAGVGMVAQAASSTAAAKAMRVERRIIRSSEQVQTLGELHSGSRI